MLERLRTRFHAKAASYHINAIHDAHLAQELLNFANHEDTDLPTDSRFQTFIDESLRFENKTLFLACCAYTLAEVNGRMDFVLAAFYASLTDFQDKLQPGYFANSSPLRFPFVSSWLLPLMGNFNGVSKYLKENRINAEKKDIEPVLLPAIRFVQQTNIAHNLETMSEMKKDEQSPKSVEIIELVYTTNNPELFLEEAARTQGNAIFWDKLYVRLIDMFDLIRK